MRLSHHGKFCYLFQAYSQFWTGYQAVGKQFLKLLYNFMPNSFFSVTVGGKLFVEIESSFQKVSHESLPLDQGFVLIVYSKSS